MGKKALGALAETLAFGLRRVKAAHRKTLALEIERQVLAHHPQADQRDIELLHGPRLTGAFQPRPT